MSRKNTTSSFIEQISFSFDAPASHKDEETIVFDLTPETKNIKALDLCNEIIAKDSTHYKASPYYIKGIYYSNINNCKCRTEKVENFLNEVPIWRVLRPRRCI